MTGLVLTPALVFACAIVGTVAALVAPAAGAEVPPIAKAGETVTITDYSPARLCRYVDDPYPDSCPLIPVGATVKVLRNYVQQFYFGKGARPRSWDVVWYKVRYKKKSGWVAEYATDRQPDGKVRNKKTWGRK